MNTPTLIASLVMAGVLVLVIAAITQGMLRGWRRRAQRQAELIGTLPPLPDTVGQAVVPAMKGLYVGSTLVKDDWSPRGGGLPAGSRLPDAPIEDLNGVTTTLFAETRGWRHHLLLFPCSHDPKIVGELESQSCCERGRLEFRLEHP